MEKSQALEHWNKFERYVKFQQKRKHLNAIKDIVTAFKSVLASPALDWAQGLVDDPDITTLDDLKIVFLKRYNPFGTSNDELDRAWDDLKLKPNEDIDSFLDRMNLLSLLAEKDDTQKAKKFRKNLPPILQLQATSLKTLEELTQLYRQTKHLISDVLPTTTTTEKPSTSSSVFTHNPYQDVSKENPTTTSVLRELRQDIDDLKHAQTVQQDPRHLTSQNFRTTHAPRGNSFSYRGNNSRGHRGGWNPRQGQSGGFRNNYRGFSRGRPNYRRNWNQNYNSNRGNRGNYRYRGSQPIYRGNNPRYSGYGGNNRGFQRNYGQNQNRQQYRQYAHNALPSSEHGEDNFAPLPGAVTCTGCLTYQHKANQCPETLHAMANLHKFFEQSTGSNL